MQKYNVILIYNNIRDKILMCKRRKDPFKGLYNLIGGKIEPDEEGLSAAYREMYEETSIVVNDIELYHLMDTVYYCHDCIVEVYIGQLKRDVSVIGDENELCWIDSNSNFFDINIFAGNGNIGHIIEEAKRVTHYWQIKY